MARVVHTKWWFLGACSLVGCNQLIGIDEAYVDERLEPKAEDGAGGSAASGTTSSEANAGATTELAAGGAGNDSEPGLCDTYCSGVMAYCSGPNQQYRDELQCLAVCLNLPEGQLGGQDGHDVACRVRYAGNARYAAGTELQAYCRAAGPGGDGRCGSDCEGYCSLMMGVCTPEVAAIYRFDSVETCLTECASLPVSPNSYSTSDPLVADGDHLQCRLFHVTSAAVLDPEEHCEHAVGVTLCQADASELHVGHE